MPASHRFQAHLGHLEDELVVVDDENPVTTGIPIVLLTAKAQGKGQPDLSALPVVGVLSKPFDPMLLPGTLASMLGWS